ncbi:hypothetical protein B0H17DRAFT_1246108 [Mycena rosella]|uniref:Uncharacterized protein n=1 Tax=Mycena rosella TaxID=1033263 RepID=A0AAD7CZX5_MYCRO|nr:hypothetical protein B0H17DRAFT_1246108 [Mycena rosella]
MSSNSLKQITYPHKRNRSKPSRILPASSPLHEFETSEASVSRSQSSPRPLKRVRRSSNPEFFFPSKLESSIVTPAASTSQFETPYPSALAEEQKFKLKSSRGLPMHPDQFSPLPTAHPVRYRTFSSNLFKENVSRRVPKKDASLDSPFNSRPNSACSSPRNRTPASSSTKQKLPKRTLSDTNYNPNIPQSASTTNSPTHSPTRPRRPSAPSPPRPGTWIPKETTFGNFDFDFHSALANPFFLSSATNDIDFNRPPSSLSFYGELDSELFDDSQAISTSANTNRAYPLDSAFEDDDEDFGDGENDRTITQDTMDVDLSMSPPASQEWTHRPQTGAYTYSPPEDFDMYDDISLGLSLRLAPLVPNEEDGASPPVLHTDRGKTRDTDLKHLFDGLALAPRTRFLTTRTRSLDSPDSPTPADSNSNARPKGRDRRGTIRASDFPIKAAFAPARRTRSGTVIGPPAAVPLSRSGALGSLDGTEPDSIGEVSEDEELNGWCSDGWAVAAPPSPVVSRKLRWPAQNASQEAHSPIRADANVGLLPSPVLQRKLRKGKGREIVSEEEGEEDEL